MPGLWPGHFLCSFIHLTFSRHQAERILIIRLECVLRVTVPVANNSRFIAAYEFYRKIITQRHAPENDLFIWQERFMEWFHNDAVFRHMVPVCPLGYLLWGFYEYIYWCVALAF